ASVPTASPLSGGPNAPVSPALAAMALDWLGDPGRAFGLVLCTEISVALSGTSVPLGSWMSVKRRSRCPMSLIALFRFSLVDSLICPFSFDPAGTMMLPMESRTGALTVAVNRSPTFDVFVESGVSSVARISVLSLRNRGSEALGGGIESDCGLAEGVGGGAWLSGGIWFCGCFGSCAAGTAPGGVAVLGVA